MPVKGAGLDTGPLSVLSPSKPILLSVGSLVVGELLIAQVRLYLLPALGKRRLDQIKPADIARLSVFTSIPPR